MTAPLGLWLLPPLLLLGVGFLYPFSQLLMIGLSHDFGAELWSDPALWRLVGFTYLQAFVSALLSGIVGTALAFAITEMRFPGRSLLWRGSLVCFSLPTILVVLALLSFWEWWVELPVLLGWPAVLLVHVFFNFSIFLKNVGTALHELDRSEEKVALSLGASRWIVLTRITLRKLWPALASSFLLAFLYCAGSFLAVLMLGGGPRFSTLEVAIYQAIKVELDLALASRLSLIQVFTSFVLFGVVRSLPEMPPAKAGSHFFSLYAPRSDWGKRLYLGCGALVLGVVVVGPLLALVWGGLRAISKTGPADWLLPLTFSVQLALLVAFLSLFSAFGLAYAERHLPWRWGKWLVAWLGNLPLSVSTVVMTLGLLLCYPLWVGNLRGSWLPIALVQTVSAMPLVLRPLRDGYQRLPNALLQVASSLGAGPWRRLLAVELPFLRGAIVTAVASAVAFSLGEVGAVLIFLAEGITTLPLEIYRCLGKYQFETAHALGVILLGVMLGLMFFIERGNRWRV